MIKEKAQVIILPTENETNIFYDNSKKEWFTSIKQCHPQTGKSINSCVEGYYLYIVSNEEIKEGDWAISDSRTLRKIVGNNHSASQGTYSNKFANQQGWKKIIATTDTSLKIGNPRCEFDDDKVLPQPSREFIEKYIKKYNKSDVITDILVEYDFNSVRTGTSKIGNTPSDEVIKIGNYDTRRQLKVSKDNTITIHPIKDSWNREEVIELLNKYAMIFQPLKRTNEEIDKWIEENL